MYVCSRVKYNKNISISISSDQHGHFISVPVAKQINFQTDYIRCDVSQVPCLLAFLPDLINQPRRVYMLSTLTSFQPFISP